MNAAKIRELERVVARDYGNTAGIVVRKDGEVRYEQYFGECTAESRIHVFSVTKSIVSILIGIAIDRGHIRRVGQRVLDFFPDYSVKRGEKTLQQVTLENLLTMTAPYKYKSNPYTRYFTNDDWVKFSLDLLGGKGEIGAFRYAPLIGPDILSGILTRTTGQSVLDFAKANLFGPLGIAVEKNVVFGSKEEQLAFYKATDISGWAADAAGINAAGWGLTLTASDMAQIGQLMLNGGAFNGKQLVSPEWIQVSTTGHSLWEALQLPYGYLWWIFEQGYAAMGDGGNVIYVNAAKKLVAAIASRFVPSARDRIELIQAHIEPAFSD